MFHLITPISFIINTMIITRRLLKIDLPLHARAMRAMQFCSDDDFKKKPKIQITNQNAQQIIKKWVESFDIVLFMKGTPQMPRCGYSGHVVQILKKYGVFQYKYINVLEDPVIREQVKIFSNWPTFPQLFIKGELVGGADIVSQMHRDSTLKQLLQQHNLI